MKRIKRKNSSKKKSFSTTTLISIILESVILISLGLGFLNISFGIITSIHIILLLLIDIGILLVLKKPFNHELIVLLFTLLLFIGPLKLVGSILIFVILIILVLKKAKIY